MKSRLGSLLVCVILSPAARAEAKPAPPPALTAPDVIPSDGVLPIFGGCSGRSSCSVLESLTITDAETGTAIAGRVEAVSTSYPGWGYFVPDAPFRSGSTLLVSSSTGYPITKVSVRVTEPGTLDKDSVRADVVLGKLRTVLESQCCPGTESMARPRCIDVVVRNSPVLTVSLSSVDPVATQYAYQLRLFAEADPQRATSSEFSPPRSDAQRPALTAPFLGTDEGYCYEVHAKPVTGGASMLLLEACVDNDLTDLGTRTRTSEEVRQWLATCSPNPVGGDASGGSDADAEDALNDHEQDADLPNADDEQVSPSSKNTGCQLAPSDAPAMTGLGWALAMSLLMRVKRKRGT